MENDVMKNDVEKRGNGDSKKITFVLILVLTLMIATTGGTYAYFALTASNAATVTGTAATVGLTLSVTEAPLGGTNSGTTKTNVMVPQLETYLGTAIGNNYKCVDGNGNTVCKVYTITVTNTSSAAAKVDGYITFNNSSMSNLKWRKISGVTNLGSNTSAAATNGTKQSLASDVNLAKTNGSQTYYIVVWIEEINTVQTDAGSFTATISFEGDDGRGVTSTVRSNS